MHKLHRSVLVNAKNSEPLKPRDRFNTGVEVTKEGVQPLTSAPFCQQWTAFLPGRLKLARHLFHKIFSNIDAAEGGQGQT